MMILNKLKNLLTINSYILKAANSLQQDLPQANLINREKEAQALRKIYLLKLIQLPQKIFFKAKTRHLPHKLPD